MLHLITALPLLFGTPSPQAPAAQTPPIPADTEIVTTPSGLKYSVLAPGDGGAHPRKGDLIKMHYTGWLIDGTVFDSSVQRRQPFEFTVGMGQVIKGWDEAAPLMTRGQKMKLTIPAVLAYGAAPRGKIPANSTLIFELELLDFASMPEFKPGNKEAQKKTESGITYEVLQAGSGEMAAASDVVSLKFAYWDAEGRLQRCTEREERNQPLTREIGQLPIPIFIEGARLLHVGERMRLEAPAKIAFGERMQPGMPPEALTVWELELVAIKKPLPVPPFALTPADKLIKTASGLGYEVIREGTGKTPAATSTVSVNYAGWLTDGKLFDSSFQRAEPSEFPLTRVVKGWTEGIQLMKEGAIYKFTIPSDLAYGKPGYPPDIGPDATLVFYIELLSVKE